MKVRNVEGGTVPRVLLDCKGGNLRRHQKFLVLLLWYYKARFPNYKLQISHGDLVSRILIIS